MTINQSPMPATWETAVEYNGTVLAYTHATFPLTINGETRDVEIKGWKRDGKQITRFETVEPVALFTKGRGGKLWPHCVTVWVQPDGSLRADLSATILNRHAYRAVRWADFATKHLSQHNSAIPA